MTQYDEGTDRLIEKRLSSIDLLRGVAVLAVILVHVPHDAPGGWRLNGWFFPSILMDFGYLGVPLFVLISGFCIHRRAAIAYRRKGEWTLDWISFWKRRFWRLYPPYVVAMLLSVVAAFYLHSRSPSIADRFGWDLMTHLLMMHNLTADFAGGMGNAAFWPLGMEEQLYGLYFGLLIMFRQSRPVLLIVALTTIVWRLLLPQFQSWRIGGETLALGTWGQWPFSYWLHWTLGAVAVDANFQNRNLPRWTMSAASVGFLLFLGIVLNDRTFSLIAGTSTGGWLLADANEQVMQTVHFLGELFVAVGFFCLLRLAIFHEDSFLTNNIVSRFLTFIGRISYSIYLAHIPVIYVMTEHLEIGNTGLNWLMRTSLFTAMSVLSGMVFYYLVERWFIDGHAPRFALNRPSTLSTTS